MKSRKLNETITSVALWLGMREGWADFRPPKTALAGIAGAFSPQGFVSCLPSEKRSAGLDPSVGQRGEKCSGGSELPHG
jgi:hypothetical protein